MFGFTGREHDDETGLQYNRRRYDYPVAERFLSEDGVGFAGDDNVYDAQRERSRFERIPFESLTWCYARSSQTMSQSDESPLA